MVTIYVLASDVFLYLLRIKDLGQKNWLSWSVAYLRHHVAICLRNGVTDLKERYFKKEWYFQDLFGFDDLISWRSFPATSSICLCGSFSLKFFYCLLEFNYLYCQFFFGNGIRDNHHFSFVVLKHFQEVLNCMSVFLLRFFFVKVLISNPVCFILSITTRNSCINIFSSAFAMMSVWIYSNIFLNASFIHYFVIIAIRRVFVLRILKIFICNSTYQIVTLF